MTNPSLLSSALSCPRPTKKTRHDHNQISSSSSRSFSTASNNNSKDGDVVKAKGCGGLKVGSGKTTTATTETEETGRICFIGDSFIRKFGLMKHSRIEVQGFKGATAKGLARPDNANRRQIIKTVSGDNIDRIIFNFGNVDVHLSYYYKLYGQTKETIDLVEIANDYVDFIASLFPSTAEGEATTPTNSKPKVIILGVYPSAPEDQHVAASLVSYGSLTQEEADKIPTKDTLRSIRRSRVDAFNTAIKEKCSALHSNIEYEDAIAEMTDPTTGKILEAFRDISDHNIHVVWETTILLWMKRWPWYSSLAPIGFESNLQRTLSKYLKTKPWAERKHITENNGYRGGVGGIQAAVDNTRDNSNNNNNSRDGDRGRGSGGGGGRNITNGHRHDDDHHHQHRTQRRHYNGHNRHSFSNGNNNNYDRRGSPSSSWNGGGGGRSSWSSGQKRKRNSNSSNNNNSYNRGGGGNRNHRHHNNRR